MKVTTMWVAAVMLMVTRIMMLMMPSMMMTMELSGICIFKF